MAAPVSLVPASSSKSVFAAIQAQQDATGITKKKIDNQVKARAAAQDFEAVFLNSMFSQMYTGIDGEGPFGGDKASGVWRSFLTDEYSKSFAKKGGVGIADHVYRSLLAQQETRQAATAPIKDPQS